MSTMTTCIIFLPASFLEGNDIFTSMIKSFQIPVISALLISLFISLLLVPCILPLASRIKKRQELAHAVRFDKSVYFFKGTVKSRVFILAGFMMLTHYVYSHAQDIDEALIEPEIDPYVSITLGLGDDIDQSSRLRLFNQWERRFLSNQESIGYKFLLAEYEPESTNNNAIFSFYPQSSKSLDESLEVLTITLNSSRSRIRI